MGRRPPELVTWRQGRCLPYGEGIAYWALGEVVKAQAGILESDASDEADAKLDAMLAEMPEAAWLRARLAPLVGLGTRGESGDRDESFAAWRGFLEDLAARTPLVLVFEDLHWADGSMLEFIDNLAEWASGAPIFCVLDGAAGAVREPPRVGWREAKRHHRVRSLPCPTWTPRA